VGKKGFVLPIIIFGFLALVISISLFIVFKFKESSKVVKTKEANITTSDDTRYLISTPTVTPKPTEEPMTFEGWKRYKSEGKFVYSTDDWSSFKDNNYKISFSFEYPKEWTAAVSIFTEPDFSDKEAPSRKVAELRGIIVLKPGQKCLDVVGKDPSESTQFLSQTDLMIGNKSAVVRVNKVFYEGGYPEWTGYWYPNRYCLMDGNKAFLMTFYEDQLNTGDKELFRKIISTVKFY